MFLGPIPANRGWASWDDWFAIAGRPERAPRTVGFDSYTYVLEAAIAGQGVALGWRGFFERYLDTGALVELADGFVEFGNRYCAVLTAKGRANPHARRCVEWLGRKA